MKKLIILIFFLFCIGHFNTNLFENSIYAFQNPLSNNTSQEVLESTLIIDGDNIWIRSEPRTGDVVFTLDAGTICKVLERGEEQTIRENTDYWYKIEYNGKTGWVFGSQTSIKQNPPEGFDDFLEKFISVLTNNDNEGIKKLVSSLHGFDYTYLVCKMEGMGVYEQVIESHFVTDHYNSGADFIELIYLFEGFDWLDTPSNREKMQSWIVLENSMIEFIVGFYHTNDVTFQFRQVEGKWFMHSVKKSICYEALGV